MQRGSRLLLSSQRLQRYQYGLRTFSAFASKRLPSAVNSKDSRLEVKTSSVEDVANALRDTAPSNNSLLAPVHISEDKDGIIKERHPATSILANSAIVVQRELEMMNVMLGFEQANMSYWIRMELTLTSW